MGPVHIGRAYASVRFYDVEGGSLLDSKGRRVANDLKRYKKSDSPLQAMSDEELEAELGLSGEPATAEPAPAESAVGANAQPIPIDPLAVFIDAIHIPAVSYTHLDVYKRQAENFPCLNGCFKLRAVRFAPVVAI